MGADLCGFMVFGPERLDAEKRPLALAAARERKEKLKALKLKAAAEDTDPDDAISIEGFDEICGEWDLDSTLAFDEEKVVTDVFDLWESGARDCWRRLVPNDPRSRVAMFCGEMSWGDTPTGFGYETLRHAVMLNVLSALEVEE